MYVAKYVAKHVAQKAIGSVPPLYRLQEAAKAVLGRWKPVESTAYVQRRMERLVERFNACRIAPPQVVVEQGTGWHGADLILFFLAGARETHTYDVRPWLNERILRSYIEQAEAIGHIVKKWQGVEPDRLDARVKALHDLKGKPLRELLRGMGVERRVTTSMKRSELLDGAVDLFYSNSVLQRMTAGDLAQLFRESTRFLKPTGQAYHVVDCKDFHSITDKRIPELFYLHVSSGIWNAMTSKYLNYQNRLRAPEFVKLAVECGLRADCGESRVTTENLEYVETRLAQLVSESAFTAEEIAVTGFELLAQCGSGGLESRGDDSRSRAAA